MGDVLRFLHILLGKLADCYLFVNFVTSGLPLLRASDVVLSDWPCVGEVKSMGAFHARSTVAFGLGALCWERGPGDDIGARYRSSLCGGGLGVLSVGLARSQKCGRAAQCVELPGHDVAHDHVGQVRFAEVRCGCPVVRVW